MRRLLVAAVASWIVTAPAAAGAATWRPLTPPRASQADAATASRSVPGLAWVASAGRLLVTHDGGASWGPSGLSSPPVEDATPGRWWQASAAGLERSDDGGSTWVPVPGLTAALSAASAGLKQLLADPARAGVLYVVASTGTSDEAGETVLASPDGGVTWAHWVVALPFSERGDLGFTDTWSPLPGRDALLLVRSGAIADDAEQVVGVVDAAGVGPLQRATGTRVQGTGGVTGLSLTGRAAVDRSGTRVLLESKRGWRLSTDAARNFVPLRPVIAAGGVPPAFDPAHAHRIYAVRGGVLGRSDDDGRHWRMLASGLRGATGLAVDAGGTVYAYGPSGLASSSDGGRTFVYRGLPGGPVAIAALHDDGRGGLLAATQRGVWRIGAGGHWSPVERDLLPLPATLATPLGMSRGVLVLRAPVSLGGQGSPDPGLGLEEVGGEGALRVIRPPPPDPRVLTGAFASDPRATRIQLGGDWTTTGGRRWRLAPAGGTSAALGVRGPVYGTRDDPVRAGRSTLWRRAGAQPWKRVAHFVGRSCRPVAAGIQRVYVACADRLLRSDDGGRTLRAVTVPQPLLSLVAIAADQRRPGHVALLFDPLPSACGQAFQGITLTSTDGGSTWRRISDRCGSAIYDRLAVSGSGNLVRWKSISGAVVPQVLDGWG